MNLSRFQLGIFGLTCIVCGIAMLSVELSADSKLFGKKAGRTATSRQLPPMVSRSEPDSAETSQLDDDERPTRLFDGAGSSASISGTTKLNDKQVKLSYISRSWDDVLHDIAKQTGLTVVMDKVPPGKFSRNDWSKYTLPEAIRVLNRELEPKGFRVLVRGQYLDVVNLQDARSEYARPVVGAVSDSSRFNREPTIAPNRAVSQDSATNQSPQVNQGRQPNRSAQFDGRIDQSGIRLAAGQRQSDRVFDEDEADDETDDEDWTDELEPRVTARPLARPSNSRSQPIARQEPRQLSTNSRTAEPRRIENSRDTGSRSIPGSHGTMQRVGGEKSRWAEVTLRHQSARAVSKSLYEAFLEKAELIEEGPGGLPGFVVWQEASKSGSAKSGSKGRGNNSAMAKAARFSVGIDTQKDRLLIDGSAADVASVKKLITRLDVPTNLDDRSVRMITSNRDVRQMAQTLKPAVAQLAENGDAEPDNPAAAKSKKNGSKKANGRALQPNAEQMNDDKAKAGEEREMPKSIGGLKGDVNVEALDDLGVLILRGNEADVEAVMSIIRQIEKLAADTTPDLHVRVLEHVDSESLAELLTSVYERLNRTRGRPASDQSQQVTVIAIGKPNAVLIVASENDIDSVNALIDKLDQPIDPVGEFEVFYLKYAIAGQVVTTLDSFFSGRTGGSTTGGASTGSTGGSSRTASGLGGRVRAIADSRTNSVIVQARPRDLAEVKRLIDELDQAGSKSVSQIKMIPLKNAVADELAEVLNLAIQSVISPPQQARSSTGGGGQNFGGGGGGAQGQVDQKLREAKSAVLQLLDGDDGEKLESGILADIRINADHRSNSLIVTAPEDSFPLIQALVRKFDQPSSLVAEIKHFTLKNADAQSVSTMLNQLFNNQQGTGRQGGGNQQNQQLGIQLAGAEDASSQLIPLKLSTDVRTNSIIAVGGGEALSVVEAVILRLDADDSRQRKMTVYRLKNSPAQTVAQAITAFLQSQSDLASQQSQGLVSNFQQFEREVIVVAESNSNSLLISATPRYYDDIMKVVDRIDAEQQQVIIQALLVEVDLQNTDEFGIELGIQDSILFDRSNVVANGVTSITEAFIRPSTVVTGNPPILTTSSVSVNQTTANVNGAPGFNFNNQPLGNNINAPNPSRVGGQGLSNFSLGRINGDLGFGGLVLSAGSDSVNALLRALSASRHTEILSRPQIRTLDNQLGRINVGQNVPVINGFTTNGALGQITPTVTRDDSGIILEVTPRITPDGRIVMQIGAERSNYDLNNGVTLTADANGNQIQAPVKNVSRAVSTISVANEQTIVLGGLIQKTSDTLQRKVPFLGDIPIIGQAFRYDSHTHRRTELLIFLTPRIIKSDSTNEMIKQIEAERIHFTECEAEALHGPLFGAPAPDWDVSTNPAYQPGNALPQQPQNQNWQQSGPLEELAPPPPSGGPKVPPMPNQPKILPVPPMSDEPISGVQGANYQSKIPRNRVTQTGGTSRTAKKKSSILDKFPR